MVICDQGVSWHGGQQGLDGERGDSPVWKQECQRWSSLWVRGASCGGEYGAARALPCGYHGIPGLRGCLWAAELGMGSCGAHRSDFGVRV